MPLGQQAEFRQFPLRQVRVQNDIDFHRRIPCVTTTIETLKSCRSLPTIQVMDPLATHT